VYGFGFKKLFTKQRCDFNLLKTLCKTEQISKVFKKSPFDYRQRKADAEPVFTWVPGHRLRVVELVIALPWIWQLRLLSAFRSANQLRLSRCRNWHSVGPCHKAGFTLPTLVFIKQGLHVNVCATIFFETFMCRFPAFINQQIAYFNIISSWV